MNEPVELMILVKEYLKITWDDEDGNIQSIINRAKSYLDNLMGLPLDYDAEDDPKSLLLDRCRYVYNNAAEYFEENFASQILRLQLRVAADQLKEANADD